MDEELIERVHALPPEIFNQIREDVLNAEIDVREVSAVTNDGAAATTKTLPITASFKYPVQLHINQQQRKAFAANLFTNATLEFDSAVVLNEFYSFLGPAFIDLIRVIEFIYNGEMTSAEHEAVDGFCRYANAHGTEFHGFDFGDTAADTRKVFAFWRVRDVIPEGITFNV